MVDPQTSVSLCVDDRERESERERDKRIYIYIFLTETQGHSFSTQTSYEGTRRRTMHSNGRQRKKLQKSRVIQVHINDVSQGTYTISLRTIVRTLFTFPIRVSVEHFCETRVRIARNANCFSSKRAVVLYAMSNDPGRILGITAEMVRGQRTSSSRVRVLSVLVISTLKKLVMTCFFLFFP